MRLASFSVIVHGEGPGIGFGPGHKLAGVHAVDRWFSPRKPCALRVEGNRIVLDKEVDKVAGGSPAGSVKR